MKYGNNNTLTVEALIKYLNEDSHKTVDKKELDKKIKYVLSHMDHVYSQSTESHKELMQFLLIMTVKYHCLFIEEYEMAYSLWRDKVDVIYAKYLSSGDGKVSESMTTLAKIELICAYKLNNLTDPLKQIIKRINVRDITVPECHSLYTNFIFSGIHLESYGYFLRRVLETEPLKDAEIIDYVYPFFPVCLSNFNNYKDIIYLNGVNHIEEGLKHKTDSILMKKITCFYKVLFSVLFDNEILCKIPDGKDENNPAAKDPCDDYNEKDIDLSFFSIFEELNESTYNEHKDILLNILHDYIDSSYRYFSIAFLDSISKFKNKNIPDLGYELLEEYLFIKGLPLMESSFQKSDFEAVTGIYKILSDKAKVMSLNKYCFEIAYSMWAAGDRDGAKKAYEYALNMGIRNVALYNNLANIYFEEKNYNRALHFYNMALGLEPENRTIKGSKDKVEKEIRHQQEKEERIIDIYMNKTKSSHKAIILAVYRYQDSSITHELLSKITGEDINSVKEGLTFLVENGLMTPVGDGIYSLEAPVKKALEKTIVSSSDNSTLSNLYKPLLYPEYKIRLYELLAELFPGYGVFPNIALKTILNINMLREFIDNKTIDSLLADTVDLCVVNISTYLPILAIDETLKYDEIHENEISYETKKALLGLLGLPLVGLHLKDNMDTEHLKSEVTNSIRDLIVEIKNCPSLYDSSFLKEIDITKFGVFYSPVDINVIQNEWESLVGPGIAQKSKIQSLKGSILSIEVSLDLKPIIQISESIISKCILNKFLFLQEIRYIWK